MDSILYAPFINLYYIRALVWLVVGANGPWLRECDPELELGGHRLCTIRGMVNEKAENTRFNLRALIPENV